MSRKRTGNVEDRGTSFRIRYYDSDGLRQYESYKTREEAESALAVRLGELASGLPVSSKPHTVLFGELADDVCTDYEINGYRSYDDLEARFRLHIIPVFGKRRAAQITTAQLRWYIKQRQQEGAATGTINRELEAIRHTLLFARDGRKLLHVPKVPHLREDNIRTGFFTREEVERLCAHLPAPLDSMTKFAFLTGWRLEECRGLEWGSVDFDKGEIRLWSGRTKTGEGRVFPMSAELRALLEPLQPKKGTAASSDKAKPAKVVVVNTAVAALTKLSPSVFPGIGDFRKSWKTAIHQAGLPCVVEPVKKGGKRGAVKVIQALRTFHDLRRSAAKNLIAQGIPERVVMQMCGWKTRSVFDRYNVVGPADLDIAREKMDAKRPANRPRQA